MGLLPPTMFGDLKELQRELKRESLDFAHENGISVGQSDSDELDTVEHMYG
ncbi:MAG: hypothetical protein IT567_02085, partial [Alphaproteobacteria bacterium]|nr:hypothetical protein [Alphaproteobacteria bacterium]